MTVEIIDPIESIAVIPNSTDLLNEVWMVCNRENGRFIERMTLRGYAVAVEDDMVTLAENQVFVDSAVTYSGTSRSSFTGLSHLEGETVSVLADGNVLDQEEVSGGSVNLASSYSLASIGLPFNSDIETVNIEVEAEA